MGGHLAYESSCSLFETSTPKHQEDDTGVGMYVDENTQNPTLDSIPASVKCVPEEGTNM